MLAEVTAAVFLREKKRTRANFSLEKDVRKTRDRRGR